MAAAAAAGSEQIFTKVLTRKDVDHRLHWPPEFMSELPDFGRGRQVDFVVKDLINGKKWEFKCSKRMSCLYAKPVISSGWLPFLRSKREVIPGYKVIFYRCPDPDAHFAIRLQKKDIHLFGVNINCGYI